MHYYCVTVFMLTLLLLVNCERTYLHHNVNQLLEHFPKFAYSDFWSQHYCQGEVEFDNVKTCPIFVCEDWICPDGTGDNDDVNCICSWPTCKVEECKTKDKSTTSATTPDDYVDYFDTTTSIPRKDKKPESEEWTLGKCINVCDGLRKLVLETIEKLHKNKNQNEHEDVYDRAFSFTKNKFNKRKPWTMPPFTTYKHRSHNNMKKKTTKKPKKTKKKSKKAKCPRECVKHYRDFDYMDINEDIQ